MNPSERVGYYARYDNSQTLFEIEVATRSSVSEPFSIGIPINTNDSGWDFSPALSADGSVLYFESRDEKLIWRIHQSMWDPKQQAFGPVVVVSPLGPSDGKQSDGGPYTTPSGDVLYFHSNRSGNGVFRAQGVGTSFAQVAKVPITFPAGVALTVGCPVVTSDELTIYFAAQESTGRSDIWVATRETKDDSFAEATPVVAVNTAGANEVPSFISEDGCRLYLDRNSNLPFHWGPPAGRSFVAEREPDSA